MIWALLTLVACQKPAIVPDAPEGLAPGQLLLLHTNDLHGHFLPGQAKWLDGQPEIGGMLELDAWVRGLEAEHSPEDVLLLDGGDLLSGTPLTDILVRGARGGAMLEFMELVGYDAWVVGNHEFDKGYDNIATLVAESSIPVVSANLDAPDGSGPAIPGLRDSVVRLVNGLKVGIIGATTEGLGHLASPETMAHIDLRPVVESVAAEAARLSPEVDLLVALTHIGLDADRALAQAVPELDLIVGGHSHTRLEDAVMEGETVIVQAGDYGKAFGMLRLTVGDDGLESFDYGLVDLVPGTAPGAPSAEMTALVEGYQARVDADYGQAISDAPRSLGRNYSAESDMGNWTSDVVRHATGVEVGLYNTGGIRADIVAGPITKMDLFEVFPFGNQVVTFELTGAELLSILLGNAIVTSEGEGGLIPVSGATVKWREVLGAPELVEILVAGEPLDPDRVYRCASNSYVVEQAERYLRGASPQHPEAFGKTIFEVAVEAASLGPIEAPSDPRIVRVD
jgi:5'-nucleotidase / UDP-sugar diphosphatase